MELPEVKAAKMDTKNFSHAFGAGIGSRVAEKAPDSSRDFALVFSNIHEDEAVTTVAKLSVPKIPIARKERRLLQSVQDGNDVFVGGAGRGDIWADLAHGDAPFTQPPDFYFRD